MPPMLGSRPNIRSCVSSLAKLVRDLLRALLGRVSWSRLFFFPLIDNVLLSSDTFDASRPPPAVAKRHVVGKRLAEFWDISGILGRVSSSAFYDSCSHEVCSGELIHVKCPEAQMTGSRTSGGTTPVAKFVIATVSDSRCLAPVHIIAKTCY